MAIAGNTHRVSIDRSKTLAQEPGTGHNRWHPAIPPIVRADPGDRVILETRDALDGQITPGTKSADLAGANLDVVHPLTGPVYINGAEPGDLLEVTIVEVEPQPFGFTVQVPGFGFLRDVFTEPYIVRWTIANGVATSPDLPGVRIPGAPFMGVIGVAPSHELLGRVNQRENDLSKRGGVVLLPDATGA